MKSLPPAFSYFCFGIALGSSCTQLNILTLFSSGFFSVCHFFYTTAQALMPAQLTELTATLPLVYSLQILAGTELI